MKQFNTLENEFHMPARTGPGSEGQPGRSQLPGKEVIHNILNYARSLQVLRKRDGECLFLIGN
jgi:hypothetical protein